MKKRPGGAPPAPIIEIPERLHVGPVQIPDSAVIDVGSVLHAPEAEDPPPGSLGSVKEREEAQPTKPGRLLYDPAPEEYDLLAIKCGLPRERVIDGVRYCRHHPEERIPWHAHPCPLCRKSGARS